MKYRLINAPIKEDYARNLLKCRGVMDYDLFINPTKECLIDPIKLDNMHEGFDLLKSNIIAGKKIIIVIDCDVDGFTSAAILWNRVKEFEPKANLEYRIHSGKQHGLEDIMDEFEESDNLPSLVVLPDASSNDYEYHTRLKNMGVNVLVLDHHEAEYESEDAIVINNQLSENYENKALTGAGVVWQFCRYFDTCVGQNGTSDKYIDLAALGIISDMASVLTLENRYIISNGLKNINNYFFQTILDKQAFSIGNKLVPWKISFYVTPLINALIRVGTMEEKEKLFQAFIDGRQIVPSTKRGEKGMTESIATQMARECTNARSRQNRIKDKAVEQLEIKIANHDLLSNKILFVRLDDDDDFPAVLNGLVATQLSARYKRPTIVARLNKEGYCRGSIRGVSNSELKDFKGFLNETGMFEYVEGHSNAAGCSIKNSDLSNFHNYANEKLSEIDFNTDVYDVNFIFDSKTDLYDFAFEIDSISDTFGQTNEEPLVVIENIKIHKDELNIIGANKDTVKIQSNGIVIMLFKAEEFLSTIATMPNVFDMTVLGTVNINEYCGSSTPQIIVRQWDVKTSSMFDF